MARLAAKRRLIILRNPEHNSRRFRNWLLEIQKEGRFLRLLINKLTIKEGIASLLINKFSKNNSYYSVYLMVPWSVHSRGFASRKKRKKKKVESGSGTGSQSFPKLCPDPRNWFRAGIEITFTNQFQFRLQNGFNSIQDTHRIPIKTNF